MRKKRKLPCSLGTKVNVGDMYVLIINNQDRPVPFNMPLVLVTYSVSSLMVVLLLHFLA